MPATELGGDLLPTVPGAPVTAPTTRWWGPPLVAAGLVATFTSVVVWRDPHVGGSLGFCPLRVLTGWACPACGALRATDDLVHGDLAEAWAHNPLWVALTPVLVVVWVRWAARRRAGRPARPLSPRWGIGMLAVLVVFAVARNVPAWQPFLGP